MKEIQQEITPITNEDLFIILNHPNAHFDYPIHCHPEYEINLVMNTRGSRIVGDSTEDFGPLAALTDKEFAVFLQLARGQSVAEVARLHSLSPSTVGTHLYHIKQKLGVANAAELALVAVRSGLIEH